MALRKLYTWNKFFLGVFSVKPLVISPRFFAAANHFKVKYKMDTVYLQQEEGEKIIQITFPFAHEPLNLNKTLNFNRDVSESLNSFLIKLNNRVQSILEKKTVRKNKKEVTNVELSVPVVESNFLVDDKPLIEEVKFEDLIRGRISGNLKLKLLDNVYDVIINAPTVTKLKLPDEIWIGSPVYPSEFEMKCGTVDNSTFIWSKSLSKNTGWTNCGEGFCYMPTEEDFGHFLKLICTPGNKLKTGPTYDLVSQTEVKELKEASEIEKRHEFTSEKTNVHEIRVVSYNILADNYINTKEGKAFLFNYCDERILKFNYRRSLLNIELIGYKADLICLQEVDRVMFKDNLHHVFKKLEFELLYSEKSGQREGCCILYDKNKFSPLRQDNYVLTNEILHSPLLEDFKEKIKDNVNVLQRLENISSLLQVVALECKERPSDVVVVGNTHLYFHPNADHIRLLQGLTVFKIVLDVIEKIKEENPDKTVSFILCGDFNSTPDCGLYQFVHEGSVNSTHKDWSSKSDEKIENLSFNNPLKMKSAYGAPKFTNYTNLFKACLDYIFFQTDHLELKQVVPLPDEKVLLPHVAIPSPYFPSDHFALVADLKFKS